MRSVQHYIHSQLFFSQRTKRYASGMENLQNHVDSQTHNKKQMQKDNRLRCYQNLILVSMCLHSSLNTLQTTVMILFLLDLSNGMGRRSFRSLHLEVPAEVSHRIRSISMLKSYLLAEEVT